MAVDQQIQVAGQASAPLSYTVPNAIEAALLCVNATINGTGASGGFLPTVEIVSDGGLVVARCPCFTTVAAGASAEVSWFRLRTPPTPATPLSLYQSTILNTANIRSYWPLNETSGTTFQDLGPSSRPLTIVGSPTLGQAPLITSGHSCILTQPGANAFSATQYGAGANGYGNWPGDGSLTVEAWIKTSSAPGWEMSILGLDDNSRRLAQFRVHSTGQLQLITFNAADNAATTATSAGLVNDGSRHYVVGTYDGTSHVLTVYVDTVSVGTNTAASSYTGDTPRPNIATRHPGATFEDPYIGTVDEVALYSRALTAAEILSHFTIGTT